MLAPREEKPRLMSLFFRDQYYRMLRWLTASIVIIFILIAMIIYILWTEPAPRYYANTSDGKILAMPRQL